jgi:GNAT superfamily N-acetyltransferase
MRYRWPEDTQFTQVVLSVEQEFCSRCQRNLHICDHRFHPILSLQGPLQLVCKLAHCPDPCCAAHGRTLSPLAETQLTLPYWLIGWDVFCWLGFRRFTRHWSIPQLQAELRDSYRIRLSDDAIAGYLQRYRCMVAARHQDQALLAGHYEDIDRLVLTIDGLQPEKGHETLYVVRELRGKRVWFAEALLSSSADEVRRLIAKAKDWAEQLGKPVELWMSDKQDAFVKGIAAEFPQVPHRYCQNHFLRDLAKPMLEKDSHAKVQMRKKVRGLRDIEKQVLQDRREAQAEVEPVSPASASAAAATREPAAAAVPAGGPVAVGPQGSSALVAGEPVAGPAAAGLVGGNPTVAGAAQAVSPPTAAEPTPAAGPALLEPGADEAGQVVLDYCACVRGILNDDQGGPLQPPGLRMAEALQEVHESLQRNLDAKKGGAASSSYASSRAASTGDCRKSPRSKSRSRSTSKRCSGSRRRWTRARAASSRGGGGSTGSSGG